MDDELCYFCKLNGNGSACNYEEKRMEIFKSNGTIDGVYWIQWKENENVLLCSGYQGDPEIKQLFFEELEENNSYVFRKLRLGEYYIKNPTSSPLLPSLSTLYNLPKLSSSPQPAPA